MNLTEDKLAYWYIDRLIYRLANVVTWHTKDLKKVVKAVEEPTPIYFDTDSIDVNPKICIVFSRRGCGRKENKKMTNGEKMKAVFGTSGNLKQCVAGLFNPEYDCTGIVCEDCPYWSENWFKVEYKAPKKVRQRRARFFSSLDELLSYVHEHEISETDVINVTKSEGLSSVNWCLTYNQYLYETPTVQTFEGRKNND